jgi:hypothetical protein
MRLKGLGIARAELANSANSHLVGWVYLQRRHTEYNRVDHFITNCVNS